MSLNDRIAEAEARLRAHDEALQRRELEADRETVRAELRSLGASPTAAKAIAFALHGEGGPVRREGDSLVYQGAPSLRYGLASYLREQWGPEQPAPTDERKGEARAVAAVHQRGGLLLAALDPSPPSPPRRGRALLAALGRRS